MTIFGKIDTDNRYFMDKLGTFPGQIRGVFRTKKDVKSLGQRIDTGFQDYSSVFKRVLCKTPKMSVKKDGNTR